MSTLTKLVLGGDGGFAPCCAGKGLATVLSARIDREAVARAPGLTMNQDVLLSQTVGCPS